MEISELEYDDGLIFIYYNTTGTKGGNSSIKALLNFIQNSTINNVTDEVTQKLHDCISKVKVSPELRVAYMRWEEKLFLETDLDKIKSWIKLAAKVNSIEEFQEKM